MKLKFFVDENLSPRLTAPLRELFDDHFFSSSGDEQLRGTLDIPLFEALNERGFNAIITIDRNQLHPRNNATERRTLHENRLHWIGVKDLQARGLLKIGVWTATLAAGLPHVLNDIEQDGVEPMWFCLKGPGVERAQRLSSGDLKHSSW